MFWASETSIKAFMIRKLKNIIEEFRQRDREILSMSRENEWAHIFHDSIRGKAWLQQLPLNIGRWAGNYAFFYVLNRILTDYRPSNILELGLGESSKFISTFIRHELKDSRHTIVEESEEWCHHFQDNFELCSRSEIIVCPLKEEKINDFCVNTYSGFEEKIKNKFDLYVIDGPFGSAHYSRCEIVKLAEQFSLTDEFVIVFDDYNRLGEQETIDDLLGVFERKGIKIYKGIFVGNKRVLVLGTKKFKFIESL